MDKSVALDRIARATYELRRAHPAFERRESYLRGEQDLPYAPPGVNDEYLDLREQAIANYIDIAIGAPVQRMRADGIRTNISDDADKMIWAIWQANKLDVRQRIIYRSMLMHGRGIASVWPNKQDRATPIIRPESLDLVYVHPDPDDPFTPDWAVKMYTVETLSPSSGGLWLPGSVTATRTVAIVYDAEGMLRFEKGGIGNAGAWDETASGTHPMKRVPFALFDLQQDAKAEVWSGIDNLLTQQDAINTIRFNTLLAMQFAAFKQRVVTGFDPRAIDENGNFLYQKNEDGSLKIDPNTGAPIPILNVPGRIGVDRLLAFPGQDTKVFDLQESNLDNYIKVLESFLVQFFSTGQIPPQYLLTQMVNLSGDALGAAESTLASLVQDMQLAAGEGNEGIAELSWYAAGNTERFSASAETNWADEEARSFAQVVDAVVKLISAGFPRRAAFEMIPGATQPKVDRWMQLSEDEEFASRLAAASRSFVDVTTLPAGGAGGDRGAPSGSDRALPAAAGDLSSGG
jgi:hypothetical protein